MLGAFEIVALDLERIDDCKEFLVVDFVVNLRPFEALAVVSD